MSDDGDFSTGILKSTGPPMAVISAAPAGIARFSAWVSGAMIGHVFIIAAFSFGVPRPPPDQIEPPGIEIIAVAVVLPTETDLPAPVTAITATEQATLPAPATSPVPDEEFSSEPEPSEQPVAAVEVVPPIAEAPEVVGSKAAPPRRRSPPRFMPRPVDAAPAAAIARPAAARNSPVDEAVRTALTGRIRNAVQSAVQCPPAARMMRQSGRAGVAFDYRNGAMAGGLVLARSSGMPVLDTAAMAAVRDAHYPDPPAEEIDHVLHLLIWVEEACGG